MCHAPKEVLEDIMSTHMTLQQLKHAKYSYFAFYQGPISQSLPERCLNVLPPHSEYLILAKHYVICLKYSNYMDDQNSKPYHLDSQHFDADSMAKMSQAIHGDVHHS